MYHIESVEPNRAILLDRLGSQYKLAEQINSRFTMIDTEQPISEKWGNAKIVLDKLNEAMPRDNKGKISERIDIALHFANEGQLHCPCLIETANKIWKHRMNNNKQDTVFQFSNYFGENPTIGWILSNVYSYYVRESKMFLLWPFIA